MRRTSRTSRRTTYDTIRVRPDVRSNRRRSSRRCAPCARTPRARPGTSPRPGARAGARRGGHRGAAPRTSARICRVPPQRGGAEGRLSARREEEGLSPPESYVHRNSKAAKRRSSEELFEAEEFSLLRVVRVSENAPQRQKQVRPRARERRRERGRVFVAAKRAPARLVRSPPRAALGVERRRDPMPRTPPRAAASTPAARMRAVRARASPPRQPRVSRARVSAPGACAARRRAFFSSARAPETSRRAQRRALDLHRRIERRRLDGGRRGNTRSVARARRNLRGLGLHARLALMRILGGVSPRVNRISSLTFLQRGCAAGRFSQSSVALRALKNQPGFAAAPSGHSSTRPRRRETNTQGTGPPSDSIRSARARARGPRTSPVFTRRRPHPARAR